MILTCPECASRYFVDDSKVGPEGRVVRCAACGHRWTARNEEAAPDLFEDAENPSLASRSDSDAAAASAAGDQPANEPEEEPPVSALPGEELPKVFRARADAERRLREATVTGIVWAGMAAVMATTERSVAAMSTSVSANTAVYEGAFEGGLSFLPVATSNLGTPWYLSDAASAGG